MSAPVFDLAARRAAQPADRDAIIKNLCEVATALSVELTRWPLIYLRESHIVGAERRLVETQRLLVALRGFVPAEDESA